MYYQFAVFYSEGINAIFFLLNTFEEDIFHHIEKSPYCTHTSELHQKTFNELILVQNTANLPIWKPFSSYSWLKEKKKSHGSSNRNTGCIFLVISLSGFL